MTVFLMCYSSHLHHHHLSLLCRLVHFQNILHQWRSLTFNRLSLIWFKATIFSLGISLHYSILSHSLTLSLLWFIIPFSRRKGSMEPWMDSAGFYSTISKSISLWTYCLLRSLLSDRYSTLVNKVIIFLC